jgi:hypothetical protein
MMSAVTPNGLQQSHQARVSARPAPPCLLWAIRCSVATRNLNLAESALQILPSKALGRAACQFLGCALLSLVVGGGTGSYDSYLESGTRCATCTGCYVMYTYT